MDNRDRIAVGWLGHRNPFFKMLHLEETEWQEFSVHKVHTIDLRQSQSSTKGCPDGLTVFRVSKLWSDPKRSFPMASILLSTWTRWDITSNICF